MKVIDFLEKANRTLLSYEIIPPLRGGTSRRIFSLVEQLMPYEPPFIDMTSRSAEAYDEQLTDGTVHRRIRRKRPGTLGLCAAIKYRYKVETVPHILCRGFTREETEDALIELNYLGIDNILAVTGDDTGRGELNGPSNQYANELVEQIVSMNRGIYLETLEDSHPTDFCIGVGGYPEKHEDSPSSEADIQFLKNKVDAGAHYIVTQMFFDNDDFFSFVNRARVAGIDIPIIPGLKILTRKSHLRLLPEYFHVAIPDELRTRVEECSPREVEAVGIEWALSQCQTLLEAKVPCIHFYIMQDASAVARIISQIR